MRTPASPAPASDELDRRPYHSFRQRVNLFWLIAKLAHLHLSPHMLFALRLCAEILAAYPLRRQQCAEQQHHADAEQHLLAIQLAQARVGEREHKEHATCDQR
jgi:hypothetical protein